MGERKLDSSNPSLITVESSSVVSSAIKYYKRSTVDMRRPLSLSFRGTPTIDAGGPKRQFFTDTLNALKDEYNLFEGSEDRLLPVYSTSVLASGLLKVIGQVIVHSVLFKGPAFAFLAPCIYKYISSGSVEEAVQCVKLSDLSPPVADTIEKVIHCSCTLRVYPYQCTNVSSNIV